MEFYLIGMNKRIQFARYKRIVNIANSLSDFIHWISYTGCYKFDALALLSQKLYETETFLR